MLARVSCDRCGLPAIWTDDPRGFLRDSCGARAACAAKTVWPIPPERSEPAQRAKAARKRGTTAVHVNPA